MDKFFSFFYELIGVSYPKASWIAVVSLGVLVGGIGAALLWGMAAKSYRDLHSTVRGAVNVTVQESPNAELRTTLAEKENEVTRLSGVVDRLQNDLKSAESKSEELRQQLDDREKRRHLRDKLGAFAERGRQLMAQCADEAHPAPEKEADAWASETEAFLQTNLGNGYIARFRSSAGLPLTATSIQSAPHRNLWSGINVRVARLAEFISELR